MYKKLLKYVITSFCSADEICTAKDDLFEDVPDLKVNGQQRCVT